MARGIKRGVEWALARLGVSSMVARYSGPRTAILTYHNIMPTGERARGVLSLHTDQAAFARQLDFLLESYDIVSLEQTLSDPPTDRSQVVITFDDGYRGTMTAGLEELERRGLPCTVFVPPGLLGDPDGFWWDRVATDDGRLDPNLRQVCLETLKGRQEEILPWARQEGISLLSVPDHGRICDESDVLEAAQRRGVTIGNHSWSHSNLTALDQEAAVADVRLAGKWLDDRLDAPVDCLAYPYGLGGALVRLPEVPWSYGLLNHGGLVQTRGVRSFPPLEVPRIHVRSGLSLEGLTLRLLGLRA